MLYAISGGVERICLLLLLLCVYQSSSANVNVAETTISAASPTSGSSNSAHVTFSNIGYYTWTAPTSGIYQFEAWGADGGNAWMSSAYSPYSDSMTGGKGAYTKGKIHLNQGDVVYVYVGGKGTNAVQISSSTNYVIQGGWNGGGNGHQDGDNNDCGGAGGGATDFRIVQGSSNGSGWNDSSSLQSRIMVAAGGGGAVATNNAGQSYYLIGRGGGTTSITAKLSGWAYYYEAAISSSGVYTYNYTGDFSNGYNGQGKFYELGSFGKGGNGRIKNSNDSSISGHGAGGGGGGWYGGIAGCTLAGNYNQSTKSNMSSRGTGGTSYISGYTGLSTYSRNGRTYSFTDYIMTSGDNLSSSTNNGNGQAKITLIEVDETLIPSQSPTSCTSNAANELFSNVGYCTWTAPVSGTYMLEAWGADGGTAWGYSSDYISLNGGRGAYTKGNITLEAGDIIYVYVGGRGTNGTAISTLTNYVTQGGWNGGGNGRQDGDKTDCGAGGGGATDFRIVQGSSNGSGWDNSSSLQSRIMVASGGGGAVATNSTTTDIYLYGHGGGASNLSAKLTGWVYYYEAAISSSGVYTYNYTGNYSEGLNGQGKYYELGSFGKGGNGKIKNANETSYSLHGAGGGGGGYYGGIAGCTLSGNPGDSGKANFSARGTGGTSYISGYPGLSTYTNNGKSYSFTDFQMISGDDLSVSTNNGNGQAKITLLEISVDTENVLVRKIWQDNGNSDGYRTSACLELQAGEFPTCHHAQLSAAGNAVGYTFAGISSGDYSVIESGETCPAGLPAAYRQVEWIQSTGTQWIDTGIYSNERTGFDIDFATYSKLTSGSGYGAILGASVTTVADFQLTTWTGNGIPTGNLLLYPTWVAAEITYESRIACSYNNGIYRSPTGTTTQIQNTYSFNNATVAIFGSNSPYGITQTSKTRLYSLKMYDGNTIIKDFLPCYRISDGEIGLYDTINGVFYTNQGTGTFYKGPDCIASVVTD